MVPVPRRLFPLLLATGLAVAFACLDVPKPAMEGHACDPSHPCLGGYRCVSSRCEAVAVDGSAPDATAPPDASSGSCTPGFPVCLEGSWYACPSGVPVLGAACADAGLDCEGARGCLASCSAAECPPGTACEEAARVCVRRPSCAAPGDCGDGGTVACEQGACLATSYGATVNGSEAALPGCFATDAGTAATGEATVKGYLVDPIGKKTGSTIGFNVLVYRASEFDTLDNPQPVLWGTTYDAGMPSADGGAGAGAGAFTLSNVPVNVDLVAESSGPGAVRTYQYFNIRPEQVQAGVAEVAVTSYDQGTWDRLVADSQVEVRAHRGGIAGQVFDCHSPAAKVRGATVALDTPARAFYTFDDLVGLDVTATATRNTGRFFFFDVPAVPLTLATSINQTSVQRTLRVRPDAVTVFLVRP